jgi:putative transposase
MLIEVGAISASRIMQSVLGRYAQYFNYRQNSFGHVFQGRPGMILCQKDSYFLKLLQYIHLNPVSHGFVREANDWPWSSHRCLAWGGLDPLVDRTLTLKIFHDDLRIAEIQYREFIDNGEPSIEIPEAPKIDASETPTAIADLGAFARLTIANAGITLGQLQGRGGSRRICQIRHSFAIEAWRAGYSASETAKYLGISASAVSQILRRKAEAFVTLSASDPDV